MSRLVGVLGWLSWLRAYTWLCVGANCYRSPGTRIGATRCSPATCATRNRCECRGCSVCLGGRVGYVRGLDAHQSLGGRNLAIFEPPTGSPAGGSGIYEARAATPPTARLVHDWLSLYASSCIGYTKIMFVIHRENILFRWAFAHCYPPSCVLSSSAKADLFHFVYDLPNPRTQQEAPD